MTGRLRTLYLVLAFIWLAMLTAALTIASSRAAGPGPSGPNPLPGLEEGVQSGTTQL